MEKKCTNSAFRPFESRCVGLVDTAPRSHAAQCFRSALYHLEKAETLLTIDPAMAAFRAITAEEEGASGIMRCLMELGYPEACLLHPRDHTHKHAVFPYLEVLQIFFQETIGQQFPTFQLHIKSQVGEDRLLLGLPIKELGRMAFPVPPLRFQVTSTSSGQPPDYTSQINKLLASKGQQSIKTFVKREANLRNELLYASPDGYPSTLSPSDGFIDERRRRVVWMIKLYLLIYPYPEHQLFVVQALKSFIKMLGDIAPARKPRTR